MEDLNENYLALQVTFSSDNKTFYAKSNPMLSTDTNMIGASGDTELFEKRSNINGFWLSDNKTSCL